MPLRPLEVVADWPTESNTVKTFCTSMSTDTRVVHRRSTMRNDRVCGTSSSGPDDPGISGCDSTEDGRFSRGDADFSPFLAFNDNLRPPLGVGRHRLALPSGQCVGIRVPGARWWGSSIGARDRRTSARVPRWSTCAPGPGRLIRSRTGILPYNNGNHVRSFPVDANDVPNVEFPRCGHASPTIEPGRRPQRNFGGLPLQRAAETGISELTN